MNPKIDIACFTLILMMVAGAGVWYKAWVEPRDEFLHAVMDCMNEDPASSSRAAYEFCAEEVRNEYR